MTANIACHAGSCKTDLECEEHPCCLPLSQPVVTAQRAQFNVRTLTSLLLVPTLCLDDALKFDLGRVVAG